MKKFSNDTTQYVEKLEAEKKALLEFVRWAAEGYGYIFTESMCNKAKDVLNLAEGKPRKTISLMVF